MAMPDFPIDPELRVRARPPVVLRRTTEAVGFVRKMALSKAGCAWRDVLQNFEAALDEWSAMEAVVHLELLIEAEGLLLGERPAHVFLPWAESISRHLMLAALRSGAVRNAPTALTSEC
jgi:hypothetical protein